VAHRPVVRRDQVFDLVREERRRIDLRRVAASVEEHDLPAIPQRLVDKQPDVGDAQPAGHEQEVAAPRVHLEALPQGAQHVDPLARPQASQPSRAAADLAEVDRDRSRGWVRGVDGERTAQDETRPVTPDVDELPGPGTDRQHRRVILLEPLAGQDLPALLELRVDELHAAGSLEAARGRSGAVSRRCVARG
jgi:hypothetical protein